MPRVTYAYELFVNSASENFECGVDSVDNIIFTVEGIKLTKEFETKPDISITILIVAY